MHLLYLTVRFCFARRIHENENAPQAVG